MGKCFGEKTAFNLFLWDGVVSFFPLIWLSRISTLNTHIKLVDKIVIIIFMGHYRPLKFIIIGLAKHKKGLTL